MYTTDDDHWLVRKKLGPGNIPGAGIKVNLIFVPHFDLKTEQKFLINFSLKVMDDCLHAVSALLSIVS